MSPYLGANQTGNAFLMFAAYEEPTVEVPTDGLIPGKNWQNFKHYWPLPNLFIIPISTTMYPSPGTMWTAPEVINKT